MSVLAELPVPTGTAVLELLPRLEALLNGTSQAVLPVPAGDVRETARLREALAPGSPIRPDAALVVATSGTTGTPKGAMLGADALRASGTATHDRLGGPGTWLLALPAHHIAGIQVLLRSVLAGTRPVVLDVSAGFDPSQLPSAVAAMSGSGSGSVRRYTSLVPTQLVKVLGDAAATRALAEFDAVLLGGAATPVPLRQRAEAAGINVVRTYGMSETAGGCVYDGVPLDGVDVDIVGAEPAGRVVLGGPTVALGYRGMPDHPAFVEPGRFRTDDAGVLTDGVLSILGRLDEAISTGGLTVVPQVVEAAVITHPAVRECAVVGLPDERLGERVVVAVVASGPLTLAELQAHVNRRLDATAVPRELYVLDALPTRGPGKIDRAALRTELAR